MTTKLFALTITITLFLSHSTMGQNVLQQNDWASIENLSVGVKLQVETKDGKKIKGKFGGASKTALVLTEGNKTTNFNKDDIQRIYRRGGISRTTSALIGAGVGAGVGGGGAAVLLGSTGGSDSGSEILAMGILIGAGVGALIGALAGKSGKRELIYEAK